MTDDQTESSANTDLLHTPGEREVWDWLSQVMGELRKARADQADDDEMEKDEQTYWGSQWDVDLPSFKLPIVVNELKTYILSEVSDLTDNPIKIFVHKDHTKGTRDENVEKAIQAEWTRNEVDLHIAIAARDSLLYPAGFLGCFVKDDAQGKKQLDIRALDPRMVYPDGDCTSDDDWSMVGFEEIKDLSWIRKTWPERGLRVKPDDAHSVKSPNASPWWQLWKRTGSGAYKGPLNASGGGTQLTGYAKARASVMTLFLYDEETEEKPEVKLDDQGQPELDEQGREKLIVVTKKKYPNGRMITGSNGVILYDGPYPFTGPFPVIRVISEPTTHEFWVRQPAIRGVRCLAQAANKMDSLVVENGLRLNSGVVVADASTGIKPSSWANIPGQFVLKGPGEFKIYYPPPMPDSMIKMGSFFRDLMAKVLGFAPNRMGAGNRGNVSAELTETEISQAMGLTRLRARLLHHSVQKLVEQMFHRMAQYYTVPRAIPYVSSRDWQPAPWEPIQKASEYGVHVDPASFMLRSKTMLQRLTLGLAKMKLVSPEYTLKTLEMPDAVEEAKKAAQAQQMAIAAHEAEKAMKKSKK